MLFYIFIKFLLYFIIFLYFVETLFNLYKINIKKQNNIKLYLKTLVFDFSNKTKINFNLFCNLIILILLIYADYTVKIILFLFLIFIYSINVYILNKHLNKVHY